jgi:hypothetical protein
MNFNFNLVAITKLAWDHLVRLETQGSVLHEHILLPVSLVSASSPVAIQGTAFPSPPPCGSAGELALMALSSRCLRLQRAMGLGRVLSGAHTQP